MKQKYTSSRDLLIQQVKLHRNEWLMRGVQETVEKVQNKKQKRFNDIKEFNDSWDEEERRIKEYNKSLFQKFSEWMMKVGI